MNNWFDTLNDALISEGLLDSWPMWSTGIAYGEVRSWVWQDGSKYGMYISVYRNAAGRYERPIHYHM
jgi:hypothetical protein